MERLTTRGHSVRVIDHRIRWHEEEAGGRLKSDESVLEGFRKATDNGNVTVIRPALIRLPLLEYISIAYYHSREIRKQIEEYRPDVVVGFGILTSLIAARCAQSRGIPFVYYVIDELHRLVPHPTLRGIARLIEQRNMRCANRVISINDELRDYTLGMGADILNTRVIGAGVDIQRLTDKDERLRSSTRMKYSFSECDTVLFFMGWLYPFSGLRELCTQLTRPEWEQERIKLLVAGEGELMADLVRIRDELAVKNRIVVEGWKPYEEIPSLLACSDICILPSLDVTIMRNIVPIKIYEYMAAGKPVISTRLRGIVREFGEDNGIHYVDGPEEVLLCAKDLKARDRIQEEGIKARRYVEPRDWENMTTDFETQLREVIESCNSAPRTRYQE